MNKKESFQKRNIARVISILGLCALAGLLVVMGFSRQEVQVNSQAEERRLIPSGQAVGMKLKTQGVMVVGVEDDRALPAKKAGIKNGDILLFANGVPIQNTRHFEEILAVVKDEVLSLTLLRGDEEKTVSLQQVRNQSGQYVCGMWLRDSAAGIGTITFFTEDKTRFAALGHPINDTDTERTYRVRRGQVELVEIKGAKKSQGNRPGELMGVLSGTRVGTIIQNGETGLWGTVENPSFVQGSAVPVCPKQEVRPGKAVIWSTVCTQTPQAYEIEIVRVLDSYDNKDFILRVTDETLLAQTGGIVQGMSGSPILQNGKLVGAVTHVLVNDSKKGYGICVERMLSKPSAGSGK